MIEHLLGRPVDKRTDINTSYDANRTNCKKAKIGYLVVQTRPPSLAPCGFPQRPSLLSPHDIIRLNAIQLPEGLFLLRPRGKEPKRIQHRDEETPIVFPSVTNDLRHPIARQIHMIVLREELARVQDVPQHHDDEHEDRLEDVEIPFVADNRGPAHRVCVGITADAVIAEVFDRAVYAADQDEEGRGVQTPDWDGNLAGYDAGATAADVEDQDHGEEEGDDHDLDDQ